MQSHSHRFKRVVLGVSLVAIIALTVAALVLANQGPQPQAQPAKPVAVVTPPPESCSGKLADLSWVAVDNDFSIRMKDKEISKVSFPENALFGAGKFYQVKSSSDYAYLEFNPDGLGGYILYPSAYEMIRVTLSNCKVDHLVDAIFGSANSAQLLDISPDEKYWAGLLVDNVGPSLVITDTATGGKYEVRQYPVPDDRYSQYDAKFSPDGSQIAVVGALGNPMSERGALWIFDMNTRTFSGYKGDGPIKTSPGGFWSLYGWSNDEDVNIEAEYGN